ncbi:MAG TPA: ADOP family duplicated permease, partial [Thermoanaerobaculia bacterium]|nr:ADOP family duplicated permease [Thermoanaerobaculia bacterium]
EPLPFADPERLVAVWESNPERGRERSNVSGANLLDWRRRVRAFDDVTAHGFVHGWALAGGGEPERVEGVEVLGNFLAVLGVEPAAGSLLDPEAHWQDRERTVVIGHDLWQRRFAGAGDVIGRRVELDGVAHTVVGVAPAGFSYPFGGLDVWVPYAWPRSVVDEVWFRRAHFLRGLARLAPGASPERAGEELSAVAAALAGEHPETNRGYGAGLTPLHEWTVGEVRRPLLVLLAAVALLLLVTCANVAHLLLARASTRGRELAVRGALGASRRRLAVQLACESAVLALLGGGLGLALASLLVRLGTGRAATLLPRADRVTVDLPVVAVAFGLTLATALFVGLLPALRLSRRSTAEALVSSARWATAGVGLARGRGLLVAAEVAVAIVLVAGAALAARSFAALAAVDPGFAPRATLTASFHLPPARYPETSGVLAFERELLARVRALPGVESAALASSLPLQGSRWTSDFRVRGVAEPGIDFNRRVISPGYFATMRAPRLRGRAFDAGDDERGRPVVIVNELLARRHFGDRDPIGELLAFGREADEGSVWREIVGVSANERIDGLAAPERIEILVPLGQETLDGSGPIRTHTLVARAASGDAAALLPEVSRVLSDLDPELPFETVGTLADLVAEASLRERLLMQVLGAFAVLALALALVGLYGLVAYSVAQERREIGIRLALGAPRAGVVRAVLGRGMALVGLGLAAGLALTLGLGRLLDSLLYGVRADDAATLAAA